MKTSDDRVEIAISSGWSSKTLHGYKYSFGFNGTPVNKTQHTACLGDHVPREIGVGTVQPDTRHRA